MCTQYTMQRTHEKPASCSCLLSPFIGGLALDIMLRYIELSTRCNEIENRLNSSYSSSKLI